VGDIDSLQIDITNQNSQLDLSRVFQLDLLVEYEFFQSSSHPLPSRLPHFRAMIARCPHAIPFSSPPVPRGANHQGVSVDDGYWLDFCGQKITTMGIIG